MRRLPALRVIPLLVWRLRTLLVLRCLLVLSCTWLAILWRAALLVTLLRISRITLLRVPLVTLLRFFWEPLQESLGPVARAEFLRRWICSLVRSVSLFPSRRPARIRSDLVEVDDAGGVLGRIVRKLPCFFFIVATLRHRPSLLESIEYCTHGCEGHIITQSS